MTKLKIACALAFGVALTSTAFAKDLNKPTAADVAPQFAPGDLGMAIMSAAINADGTIARGEGVIATGTNNIGTGVYEVAFGRDITECTYQVTAGESGIGSAVPRVVAVTRRAGNPAGVFLQVQDNAGTQINNPFFVLVYCGR